MSEVFAVNVNWNADNREWNVNAWPLDDNRWHVGNQVLARNSTISPVYLGGSFRLQPLSPPAEHSAYFGEMFG